MLIAGGIELGIMRFPEPSEHVERLDLKARKMSDDLKDLASRYDNAIKAFWHYAGNELEKAHF